MQILQNISHTISLEESERIKQLQETAVRLSAQIIRMTTTAGSGHPSSSLSTIDILTTLFFGDILRYDPQWPDDPHRDRFILSKGHAAPALYAVLAEAGYFEAAKLETLRQLGSSLEGHPNMRLLAGVEASTGSLGQGLSIGLGHALAARLGNHAYRVYVLIGDGETQQGQIWEAAMAAAKYKVDNLTAILDYNKYQQTGPLRQVMPSFEPIEDKWHSFGWAVKTIEGHNIPQIKAAFHELQQIRGRPQILIAHTLKGRGLSSFEASKSNRKHGEVLDAGEMQSSLAELQRQEA